MEQALNEFSFTTRFAARSLFPVANHRRDYSKSVDAVLRPGAGRGAIDWHTIITLSGLMLLTKGVELSGYFDVLGRK